MNKIFLGGGHSKPACFGVEDAALKGLLEGSLLCGTAYPTLILSLATCDFDSTSEWLLRVLFCLRARHWVGEIKGWSTASFVLTSAPSQRKREGGGLFTTFYSE